MLPRNLLLKLRQRRILRHSWQVIRIADPMAYICNILLGRITKTSGYEGAVNVILERSFIGNIPHMESVFVEIDERPVPFFIYDYHYAGSDILKLKFTDYDTVDRVSELKGCRVFLTSGEKVTDDSDGFSEITGYEVYTMDNILLGRIKEIIQNPGQYLLSITSPDRKEILIPLHEDFIVNLDDTGRKLILNIPEGLKDLN
ncbi:MAG: 16S rRNA processing protein RimM [Bacteroidia bacterium]|nr:16S rRNA processing protein RimM [Bacteroidia bacterium]